MSIYSVSPSSTFFYISRPLVRVVFGYSGFKDPMWRITPPLSFFLSVRFSTLSSLLGFFVFYHDLRSSKTPHLGIGYSGVRGSPFDVILYLGKFWYISVARTPVLYE